jgi:hypothetical protein
MITRPEQSYQLWRVVVCDNETSCRARDDDDDDNDDDNNNHNNNIEAEKILNIRISQ